MGRGRRGDREIGPRRRALWVPGVLGLVFLVGTAVWLAVPMDGATGQPAPHRGGPRLVIDPEVIDFGAVRYNQFVEARFRLTNVGDQPLRLPASPPVEVVEGC